MGSEQLLSKKTAMAPTSNISSSTTSIDDLPLPTDSPFAVDSPEFWRYITTVRSKGESLAEAAAAPAQELKKVYCGGNDMYLHFCTNGWSAYRKYLAMAGIKGYEKFAGLFSSLGGIRSIMDREVETKFIEKMNSFGSRELRQLNHSKKAYDCLNDPYLADVKKFLQSKTDTVLECSLRKEQKKIQIQQQFLDLTRFDVKSKAEDLDESMNVNALRPLYEALRAHWEFFDSGYNLMLRFKDKIDELKTHIEELEEDQKKRVTARRAQRRQLEKLTAVRSEVSGQEQEERSGAGNQLCRGIRDLDEHCHKTDSSNASTSKEGFLWVAISGSNASALPLTRAWCVVDQERICISIPCQPPLVMNLLLCTVKEGRELNLQYCFQIISPNRQLSLQTLTRGDMREWIEHIQRGISHQLNTQMQSDGLEPEAAAQVDELIAFPGNDICADCSAANPDWVSKNLGILVCKKCSGVHRSLGVHISKIRSLRLDKLDDSLLQFIQEIGNRSSNSIWLSDAPSDRRAPTPETAREELTAWITDKYNGKFMKRPACSQEALNRSMFDAVGREDILDGLRLIALGVDLNFMNKDEELRTALHQAVDKGNEVFVEMLVQNDANVSAVEARGWTPLHYAAYRDNVRLIKALLRRGACVTTPDYQNSDVLALSLEYECIECEPILREAHVRERQRLVRNQQQAAIANATATATTSSPDLPLPPIPTTTTTPTTTEDDERSAKSGLRKRLGTFFGRERSKNSTPSPSPTSPPRAPNATLDAADAAAAAADARRTPS